MSTDNHTDRAGVGDEALVADVTLPDGELDAAIGNRTTLLTTAQGSLVGAVNEVYTRLAGSVDADGTLKAGAVDVPAVLADNVVTAAKLAAAVAGDGLAGGAGTPLSVSVDNSTIELSGDAIRAKDGGLTNAKLATDVKVGSLAALTTTIKTSVQAAINELVTSIGANLAMIVSLAGGATVANNRLKEWTDGEQYIFPSPTPHATYTNLPASGSTVTWPDGSSGVFTIDTIDTTWQVVSAYHITHATSSKTVTQTAIVRNATGFATTKPALTVA